MAVCWLERIGSLESMTSASYPFCIATVVTHKAIEAMLEAGGAGSYRDDHPWLVARDLLARAHAAEEQLPILFASKEDDQPSYFSHWSVVNNIDVVELHRGQWDSRCSFGHLRPMNPIWQSIDSVLIKASEEQMERETREGIRVYRTALDEHHIHPYAICETPAFIQEALGVRDGEVGGVGES
jgi:hypothetical protein